ncbi:MAG: PAS domain-containing protein [Ahrensia sp.]
MALHFDIANEQKAPQDLARIGLDDIRLLDALAGFDPYGAWRLDIQKGLAYWSEDVFRIHEMPINVGEPVDLTAAINAYHPDDRSHVIECIEEAAKKRSGFRFVLRLLGESGETRLVKSTGRFRINAKGEQELYGTFSLFQTAIRSVIIGK